MSCTSISIQGLGVTSIAGVARGFTEEIHVAHWMGLGAVFQEGSGGSSTAAVETVEVALAPYLPLHPRSSLVWAQESFL